MTHGKYPLLEIVRKHRMYLYPKFVPKNTQNHIRIMIDDTTPSNGIIALYARTSTDEQADGIESQLDSCRRKLDEDDLARSKLYKDEAVSGAKDDRPAFNRLQQDIANGKVEKVVVSELSRLSRNTLTLMEFLEQVFDDELGLIVADGQFPSFDEGNPFLEALARMMAVLAQLERDLIMARTERGIRRAANQGKWTKGRPPRGFSTDDDGFLVVDFEDYARVVGAIELIEKGGSVYSVARAADIPQSTLSEIYNDEEKRKLYTRQETDDELKREALNKADGDLRSESELSKLWNEMGEMREMLEDAIDYDEEEVEEQYGDA